MDYGAINDGVTDIRAAINRAITVCSNTQGGTVLIPRGKYYVAGPVIMKSNVNLKIEEDAEIIFSSNPKDYTPFVLVVWEGTELFNYSPLVYGYRTTESHIPKDHIVKG